MTDFSVVKNIDTPDGSIAKIQIALNLIGSSIDTDGVTFNNCGYLDGYRLSSSGDIKEHLSTYSESTVTGFIPATDGDTIYISGCYWYNKNSAINYICSYDADFNFIGAEYSSGIANSNYAYGTAFVESVSGNIQRTRIVLKTGLDIAYIRVSCTSALYGQTISGKSIFVSCRSRAATLWQRYTYTNQVPISIGTDGAIFNGGLGYKDGYRLSSSGGESGSSFSTVTGFIPAKAGDVIRIKGYRWYSTASSIHYLIAYNSTNSFAKVYTANSRSAYQTSSFVESMDYSNGVSTVRLKSGVSGYDHIRLSMQNITEDDVVGSGDAKGANLIVTVNEEIE